MDTDNSNSNSNLNLTSIHDEIAGLESRLPLACSKLPANSTSSTPPHPNISTPTSTHFFLLLSDSALPLGSFAFSSGLESYIAHQQPPRPTPRQSIERFLRLSLHSLSGGTLPFVIAAWTTPSDAPLLDDIFDASTTCAVARRASISQGRALVSVYQKSFSASLSSSTDIEAYREALRRGGASGHFGVVWGLVCRVCGLALEETGYLFLLNHAKATLSAGVRQSLIGPYQGQGVLAGEGVREWVKEGLEVGRRTSVEMAGQGVPVLDVYQGRHELLYSRVFNS